YSGGVIKGHWYWGNLGIDLKGMKFVKPKYPLLEDHYTSKKIGWMGKPIVAESLKVNPDKVTFLDTDAATEFQQNADKGFPYESSLYAIPSRIERIEEGAHAMFNGHKLDGPGTIWRECLFKEASVCTFGYDSNTSAKMFSEELDLEYEEEFVELSSSEDEKTNVNVKEVKNMDLETLKKEHPELVSALSEEVKTGLQSQFDKEKADLQAKLDAKGKEVDQLSGDVAELKKRDTIRTDKEHRVESERIFAKKLTDSDVPEHLHDKCMGTVSYAKFVKEGVFDTEAFGKAVDEEIKDWETRLSQSVQGGVSQTGKELDADKKKAEQMTADDDAAVEKMLALAGVVGDTE
ncbi:MAG: hypothetical protein ABIH23_26815, partial [bacterium]